MQRSDLEDREAVDCDQLDPLDVCRWQVFLLLFARECVQRSVAQRHPYP